MMITIVLPTYNERENIKELIPKIFEIFKERNIDGNLIVVDDNSSDNTAEEVRNLSDKYPITLIERKEKLGIGSAYILGFKRALNEKADVIFEMDADLSHDPEYIPEFLNELKGNDLVIGSRYIPGGNIENWNLSRKVLSKGANTLARLLTGLNLRDITTGYRAYKSHVLRKIDLDSIKSDGYAFQLEMLFNVQKEGSKIKEIPIIFKERTKGRSKLSKMEILKFFVMCIWLSLKKPYFWLLNHWQRNRMIYIYSILAFMTLFYIYALSAISINKFNRFEFPDFDIAIADQEIWLASQGKDLFITVRGLHMLGNHARYIHILISPIYWFTDDIRVLLIIQAFCFGITGLGLFLIFREKFKDRYIPASLFIVLSYLMYPATHFSNLENYHVESLAVPLITFGFYFLLSKRYIPHIICMVLTLLCKEEMVFTVFMIGLYSIYFLWRQDKKAIKKVSLPVISFCVIWFLFVFMVSFPFFNKDIPGYEKKKAYHVSKVSGSFGSTPTEKIKSLLNPEFMSKKIFTDKNRKYVHELFFPIGYIALLSPETMVLSASFFINILSDWSYTHSIKYHYTAVVIPFVYISLIFALSRIDDIIKKISAVLLHSNVKKTRAFVVYGLCLLVVFLTLESNTQFSHYNTNLKNMKHIKFDLTHYNYKNDKYRAVQGLIAQIPRNASVTTTYHFLAHLSHREKIFMFPNPFEVSNYGYEVKEHPPDVEIDYLLIERRIAKKHQYIIDDLVASGQYKLIDESMGVELYKRIV